MNERARLIVMGVAVLAVAGGGGYYFLGVYRPRQVRRQAQAEITAWEARWKDARDCLLGPHPASSKTSEALAVREMSPDPWDRQSCTPKISKLSRGSAPNTGLDAVEKAWEELDAAAGKAAQAFALHVASSTTLKEDPLPAALDALDAARMSLRNAAGLPVDGAAGQPLPAAQVLPLRAGAEPVTELPVDGLPSAHGIVLFGSTASGAVQVTLVAGGAPKVSRVAAGMVRAVPDGSWGAAVIGQTVSAGALDGQGAMASPVALDPVTKNPDDRVAIAAVIGPASDQVVVYGATGQLAIAELRGGKPAVAREAIDFGLASTDVDGRAVVAWTAADHKTSRAELLAPGAAAAPVPLPGALAGTPCLSGDRAWLVAGDHLLALAGGTFDLGPSQGQLIGCTPAGALVRSLEDPRRILLCAKDCKPIEMGTGAPDGATLTVAGGKLLAIAEHAGVLGVWRDDNTRTFYALPADAQPRIALTDGKVVDVLAEGDKGFVVVRLPGA